MQALASSSLAHWACLTALGNAVTTAILTLTVIVLHFTIAYQTRRGAWKTIGGVQNPELRARDLIRFVGKLFITLAPFSGYVMATLSSRAFRLDILPSVLQIALFTPASVLLQDTWHYFVHRWMHSTKLQWVRNLHRHHHSHVIQQKGMLCTDLLAVNPLEYWLAIVPAYVLSYELSALLLPQANFWSFYFSFYITGTILELGHCNVDIPNLPPAFLRKFGFIHPTDHAMHHHNARANFGIFTTVMDRTFGTYKPFVAPGGDGGDDSKKAGPAKRQQRKRYI